MFRFFACAALSAVMLWSCAGCAIVEKENRRTLNMLDKNVHFESTGAKIAAGVVFVPVGVGAAITDAVIVHPIVSIPKAFDDTSEAIWENPEGSDFRQMLLFLPKVVVTPLYFVGDWTLRVLFPID